METDQVTSQAVATADAPFDAFAFGLVPIFQRDGRAALADQLRTVTDVDNLRTMARAQKIALPADIRRGDPTIDQVRDAIIVSVEKRIADRRAAAG